MRRTAGSARAAVSRSCLAGASTLWHRDNRPCILRVAEQGAAAMSMRRPPPEAGLAIAHLP